MIIEFKKSYRSIVGAIYNIVFIRLFGVWERFGFHITPNHFYQPIPDSRTLTDELWLKQTQLVGINMREQDQINLLNQFSAKFKNEYNGLMTENLAKLKQFWPGVFLLP